MITCTKILTFDAGHRVYGHESKCANLHGHTYRVEITAHAPRLDQVGRVVDFSVLKQLVGGWIDRCWDHAFLFWKDDLELERAFSREELINTRSYRCPFNPTAENMADYLLRIVCLAQLAGTGVEAVKVKVWETPTCFAEASL